MSKFIVLSKKIINPKFISFIEIKPKLYKINMVPKDISGFLIFGSGWLDVDEDETNIRICADKNPDDYATFTEWIATQR
jgi:hypothetical protein